MVYPIASNPGPRELQCMLVFVASPLISQHTGYLGLNRVLIKGWEAQKKKKKTCITIVYQET